MLLKQGFAKLTSTLIFFVGKPCKSEKDEEDYL